MNQTAIKAIEHILSRGDRAEVIPGPNNSVKVIRIRREVAYQPENPAKMVKAPPTMESAHGS